MIICGCDPGLDGAISFLDPAKFAIAIDDMPTLLLKRGGKSKREVDGHALVRIFRRQRPDHVFLEIAGAVPRIKSEGTNRKGGQGVSSAFASGEGYGIIRGVLAALDIPYSRVPAQVWKKKLGVPAEKDGARARAQQLLPASADLWPLKKHHGRAEAALIALHGARELSIAMQKTEVGAAADLFAEATA
jgi:crossover junction endodeoxyribonuclease RuvC